MKQTKLILTRTALLLFVMFMTQTVWAQTTTQVNFFMHRAEVTFQVGERKVTVPGELEQTQNAFLAGTTENDLKHGFTPKRVTPESGKPYYVYPNDELWDEYTGAPVELTITKIVVPGRMVGDDDDNCDCLLTLEGDEIANRVEITYGGSFGNVYAHTHIFKDGNGGAAKAEYNNWIVITSKFVGNGNANTYIAPEGTVTDMEGNAINDDQNRIRVRYAGSKVTNAACHPGFVLKGDAITYDNQDRPCGSQGKYQRPISFVVKPRTLWVAAAPKKAYENLYTVRNTESGASEKFGYDRYYNGEEVTIDELDVTITNLPENHTTSGFTPSLAPNISVSPSLGGEPEVSPILNAGDYGWVKPYSTDASECTIYRTTSIEIETLEGIDGKEDESGKETATKNEDVSDCFTWAVLKESEFIVVAPHPVNLTVTGNVATASYDGTIQVIDGYKVTSASSAILITADAFAEIFGEEQMGSIHVSGEPKASGTNAGKYDMKITGAEITDDNFVANNVTVAQGYLQIDPCADEVVVGIVGLTGQHQYDNKPFEVTGYVAKEVLNLEANPIAANYKLERALLKEGDKALAVNEGIELGKAYMGLTPERFENKDGNFSNVTFEITDGWAEIIPAVFDVNLTGNTKDATYTGSVQAVSGFTASYDNELFKDEYIAYHGSTAEKPSVTSSSEGKHYMKMKGADFSSANELFAPVFKITEDGWLNISYYEATLYDNVDNTAEIQKIARRYGAVANVTLVRAFPMDGTWYTICLPFAVDLTAENCDLKDADVREMTEASLDGGKMTLNFSETSVTSMEAGKPYLIKWAKPEGVSSSTIVALVFGEAEFDEDLEEQVVENPFDLGDGKSITFKGTYAPVSYDEADDNSVLLVGDNNSLYYPTKGASLGAFRASFQLEGLTAYEPAAVEEEAASEAPVFVLSFGATNVKNAIMEAVSGEYYDLSGRRVAQPTKGIYIVNGKKVVVK